MASSTATTDAVIVVDPQPLPTRILTPSPYPHHTRGPSSARFRNALSRVTTHPTSDAEAWSALLTEVQTCWRQVLQAQQQQSSFLASAEGAAQVDFCVSCYATVVHYFPYCAPYWVQLGEILWHVSARPGEPGGSPSTNTTNTPSTTQRSQQKF